MSPTTIIRTDPETGISGPGAHVANPDLEGAGEAALWLLDAGVNLLGFDGVKETVEDTFDPEEDMSLVEAIKNHVSVNPKLGIANSEFRFTEAPPPIDEAKIRGMPFEEKGFMSRASLSPNLVKQVLPKAARKKIYDAIRKKADDGTFQYKNLKEALEATTLSINVKWVTYQTTAPKNLPHAESSPWGSQWSKQFSLQTFSVSLTLDTANAVPPNGFESLGKIGTFGGPTLFKKVNIDRVTDGWFQVREPVIDTESVASESEVLPGAAGGTNKFLEGVTRQGSRTDKELMNDALEDANDLDNITFGEDAFFSPIY